MDAQKSISVALHESIRGSALLHRGADIPRIKPSPNCEGESLGVGDSLPEQQQVDQQLHHVSAACPPGGTCDFLGHGGVGGGHVYPCRAR